MKSFTAKSAGMIILRHECGCAAIMGYEDGAKDRRRYKARAKRDGLTAERPAVGDDVLLECDDPACIGRAVRKVNLAKRERVAR